MEMDELAGRRCALVGAKIAELGSDDTLSFDAVQLAPLLGLQPPAFMRAVRQGLVYQVFERGIGTDAGTLRVSFRYRARQVILVLDEVGRVLRVG